MFSLQRRSTAFLRITVAVLLLAVLPAAAAPATATQGADPIVTARQWIGDLLDSVLAAFGLTGGTEEPEDPEDLLTGTVPVNDPAGESTTPEEPEGESGLGPWDPNG